jgi:threonine/homoserine/homoserine lactone efflux protein
MKILGIAAGFGIQVIAVGAGLGMLMARWPQIGIELRWLGAGCASYLGWRLLRSRRGSSRCGVELLSFGEVAARQFLNPVAWLISLVTGTLLLPPYLHQVLTCGVAGRI